jgi:tetratricopeptide (TPR) repeat protein
MRDLENQLDQALAVHEKGDVDAAIILYEEILSEKEDWSRPHYNLGLIYKYRCDWKKSYYHNKRAVALEPENEAAQWNLGIAATMLEDWKLVRSCWNFFGMNYDILHEDTAGDVGRAPVRINPNTEGEVVWTVRICPARAIIHNIPYPESNHRYKDMVLNDGAPNGHRLWEDKEYSVFDEIEHLSKSDYQTFSIKCKLHDDNHFVILRAKCEESDIAIENWTTGVRILCRQCSEGKPHESHDHDLKETKDEYLIAFASTSEDTLVSVLESWSRETGVDYYECHCY